jgi:hypothetical protein
MISRCIGLGLGSDGKSEKNVFSATQRFSIVWLAYTKLHIAELL